MTPKDKVRSIWIIISKYFLIQFCLSVFAVSIIISIFGLRFNPFTNHLTLYIGLIFGFLAFFLWFKKLDENGKVVKNITEYFSLLFFIGLILISVFNLKILVKFSLPHNVFLLLTVVTMFSGVI